MMDDTHMMAGKDEIKNDGCCIKNDGFCVKNDDRESGPGTLRFLYRNEDFSIENEDSSMILQYKMKILLLKMMFFAGCCVW